MPRKRQESYLGSGERLRETQASEGEGREQRKPVQHPPQVELLSAIQAALNHVVGVGSEAGSYLRLIDSCITQFKAQGPSRTCNESKEEEEVGRIPGTRRESA